MSGDRGADSGAGGDPGGEADCVGRLSRISSRTSMMTIDAVLRAVPRDGRGYAAAAEELRGIARRVVHTTRDFAASLPDAR